MSLCVTVSCPCISCTREPIEWNVYALNHKCHVDQISKWQTLVQQITRICYMLYIFQMTFLLHCVCEQKVGFHFVKWCYIPWFMPPIIAVTSQWASWRLKSPAIWLFVLTICLDYHRRKPALLALCEGNPSVSGGFSSQRASNAETASIWWRYHVNATLRNAGK